MSRTDPGVRCSACRLPLAAYYLVTIICCLSPAVPCEGAFLNFGGGPRNAALGGAIVAGESDAFSGQLNAAMLSLMKNSQFMFEYQNLYAGLPRPDTSVPGYKSPDISVSNVGMAVPFRRLIGTFGVSYLRYGNSDIYTEETIALQVARTLNDLILRNEDESIGIGLGLKFLRRSVEPDEFTRDTFNRIGNSADSVTMDLGSFYKPAGNLSIGLSLQNLAGADVGIVKKDLVPKEIIGGISWLEPMGELARGTELYAAISKREGELRTNFHLGVSASFPIIAPRIGFNRDEFAAGFGLNLSGLISKAVTLDYAFVFPLEVSGSMGSHRIGVRIDWGVND